MGVTRVLIFAIDPYQEQGNLGPGLCTTISYADVPDGNDTEKAFTCAYVPPSKGLGVSIAQETMFLGTTSAAGKMYQTLDRRLSLDGSTAITYDVITARVDPDNSSDSSSRESTTKRYDVLDFNGPSFLDFSGTGYWAKDCNPVEDASVTWKTFQHQAGKTGLYFESGLANWIHVRATGSSPNSGSTVFSGFTVRYRHIGKGVEGRES